MEIMKYPNVSGGPNMAGNTTHIDEVDSLFTSTCWQNSSSGVGGGGGTNSASPENSNLHSADYMDTHKLILDSSMSSLGSDKLLLGSPIDDSDSSKNTIDDLGYLLVNNTSINTSLAELKPLPPFTGYTANLSINGIQGHHYHAIAQRIPEENNNYSNYSEQNIVSSSTCNVVSADSSEVSNGKTSTTLYSVDDVCKIEYDCVDSSAKLYENSDGAVTQVKTEIAEYDISSIEDIAAIIGSAIADTTVPNPNNDDDNNTSRDSWMDLDAWIDGACGDQQKSLVITQEGLSEFIIPNTTTSNSAGQDFNKMEYKPPPQPPQPQGSTLQNLLTHGYMPLLQNRLQNGPPIKQEMPSSSNYNNSDLISTSSPPSNVVSTTDNLMLTVNGRFLTQYSLVDDRIRSPDILGPNYPHTTTASTPIVPKKSRSRAQKKAAQQQQQAASSTVFQAEQSLGLLGKEKPVHRCSICNRGFLNKSNIKVHLRTHTGEKPFRCDTCAKAFRQKAHLLKHQQIHKRIGRD